MLYQLGINEEAVDAILIYQLIVISSLCDVSLIEYKNVVCVSNGG